jgi:hypothetical protein
LLYFIAHRIDSTSISGKQVYFSNALLLPQCRRSILNVNLQQAIPVNHEYIFPVVVQDNKRLALRHHVSIYSGYTVSVINRLIESGEIGTHLVGYQIYVDVDQALTVLSKSRFHPKKSALAASKILSDEQKADLFA